MNLLYGTIVEIFPTEEMRAGKVRVGGALTRINLDLIAVPRVGDQILVCDGIAISKIDQNIITEKTYVSRDTRQTR